MTNKSRRRNRLDPRDAQKISEDIMVSMYGNKKERTKSIFLYSIATFIVLFLIYPVMKFAIFCYELGFISKSLSAYLGGMLLVGISLSASYLICRIFLQKYFK